MPKNKPFRRRQLRTMFILIAVMAVLVGGGAAILYRRAQPVATTDPAADALAADVSAAMLRLSGRTPEETAQVQTTAQSVNQKAELLLEGMADAETMGQIAQLLTQQGTQATFFFTAKEASQNPASLAAILNAGFSVGASGQSEALDWEKRAGQTLVGELCQTNLQFLDSAGMQPTRLLASSAAVPEEKLNAAYACYYAQVAAAQTSVDALSFLKQEDAESFVERLPRGSLVLFHIDNAQAGLLDALTWLTGSLRQTDLTLKAQEMLTQNAGQEAQAVNHIYTTERAVAYTFSGLGNDKELNHLLDTLDELSAKAVFFVTTDELQGSKETVSLLLSRGHDVGLGVRLIGQTTARELLSDLLLGRELLKNEYGYQEEVALARPVYGHLNDSLREAAAAGGFTLLMARANPVKASDARATNAETVFEGMYADSPHMLQRGDVLHFTMNQYTQSDTLLGDLARLIHRGRNIYALRSAAKMMKSELCYAYPLSDDAVLPAVRGRIFPGQLQGGLMKAMRERYIGSHWVNTTGMLPGFIRSEIAAIDKKGEIPNDSDMVFLSFDDWGTDGTITKLLDVLKKHNVVATFFVYTGNVVYNPNLLRAIAMDGHTIGCHTNSHRALANALDSSSEPIYGDLSDEEAKALEEDLVASYAFLQSVVGDVKNENGRPALSTLFRPPTLAVSKLGLQTVFDCGFSYSVSGSLSTQDYKAESAEELAKNLRKNVHSGSVVVMHMSDTSRYTAEALDLYLTGLEEQKGGNPYRFVSLLDALPDGVDIGTADAEQ